ncbi:MAG TPA: hypothetical protein VGK43_06770 [Solirubrobacterales bacterium]
MDTQTDEYGREVLPTLPEGFDFDLFVKGMTAAMQSLFNRTSQNTVGDGVISAVQNAIGIGFEFERQVRPIKRASQTKGRK